MLYVKGLVEIRLEVMASCADADEARWLEAEKIYLEARTEMRPPSISKRLANQYVTEGIIFEQQPRPMLLLKIGGPSSTAENTATTGLRSRSTWRCRRRKSAHRKAPKMPDARSAPPPPPPSSSSRDPPPLYDAESAQLGRIDVGGLGRAAVAARRRQEAEEQRRARADDEAVVVAELRKADDQTSAAADEASASKAVSKIQDEGALEEPQGASNPAADFAFVTATRTLSSVVRTYDASAIVASSRPLLIAIRHFAAYADAVRPTLRHAARAYVHGLLASSSGDTPTALTSPTELVKRLDAMRHVLTVCRASHTLPLAAHARAWHVEVLVQQLGMTPAEVSRIDDAVLVSTIGSDSKPFAHLDAIGVRAAVATLRAGWPRLVPLAGDTHLLRPVLKTMATYTLVSAVQSASASLSRVVNAQVDLALGGIAHPKHRTAVAGPAAKAIQRYILEAPLQLAFACPPSTTRDERQARLCRFLLALLRSRGALTEADAVGYLTALESIALRQVAALASSLGPRDRPASARSLLKAEPTSLLRWLHALNLAQPAKGEPELDRGIAPVRRHLSPADDR